MQKFGLPTKLSFSDQSNLFPQQRSKEASAMLAEFDMKYKDQVAANLILKNAFDVLEQKFKMNYLQDLVRFKQITTYIL